MASVPLSAARQLALDRLAEGDTEGALALISQITAGCPGDRRTSFLGGRIHLAAGDVQSARGELERAAAAFPDDREVWEALAACGSSEEVDAVLADLPPLPANDGQRAPISGIALGHLFLRQLLLAHCTAQLDPAWRGDGTRRDVGVALAEAHWRLGETDVAETICRSVLEGAPECVKANLILAQQLWAAGRREAAAPLIAAAEAADPENALAEELYEWLLVRDPGLVPLRSKDVSVELEDAAAVTLASAEEAAPPAVEEVAALAAEEVAPAAEEVAPEPVHEELGALEGVLGGFGPLHEPIGEPEPFWERPVEPEQAEEFEPAAAVRGEPEPPPEPEPSPEPEPAPVEADIAATAPEPALAPVEAEAERGEALALHWLEVTVRGQIIERRAPSPEQERQLLAWNESCTRLGERLRLGDMRAASIDSPQGALQLVREGESATVALAPVGANLGLLRAKLRRSHHLS